MQTPSPHSIQDWRQILVENALDAVVGINKDSTIIDWNKQAEEIFGWNKEEAIGRYLPEVIIPPEFRQAHKAGVQKFLETGNGPILRKRIELEALHRSGRRVQIELTVFPILSEKEPLFYSFIRDISERITIERARAQQNERLKQLFDLAPMAISIRSAPDFTYEYVNQAHLKMVNKVEKDLIGKRPEQVFHIPEAENILNQILQTKKALIKTEFAVGMGNEDRYFNFTGQPLLNEAGEVESLVTFSHEVTDLVRARKKAEESESQLRLIIDSSPAFIAFLDENITYRFINNQYEKFFGIPREEIIGKHVRYFVGEEGFNKLKPFYDKTFKGEATRTESPVTNRFGQNLIVEVQYVPFRPNGKVTGIILVAHDITERKIVEEDQRLLAQLTTFIAKAPDEEVLVSHITELLARYLKASRCWMAEVKPKSSEAIVRSEYAENLPSLKGAHNLTAFGSELVKAWKSGSIVQASDVKVHPLTSENAQAHIAIGIRSFISIPLLRHGELADFFNISSHEPHQWSGREIELTRSVAEMLWSTIEKNRLVAALKSAVKTRDDFISICSHELNTPLTSMSLQFQLAQKLIEENNPKVYSPELVQRRVNVTTKQLDRMAKLIDSMLDVSRIASGKLKLATGPVDLASLIQEVLERFHEQFVIMQVEVDFQDRSQQRLVLGDEARLEQVFSNLITNALKYGEGNPITICLENVEERISVKVKDQGIGITPENKERVFEQFERAIDHMNITGLGLGLYVSKQIVNAHHGQIWVESERGKGSTFVVELPLLKE